MQGHPLAGRIVVLFLLDSPTPRFAPQYSRQLLDAYHYLLSMDVPLSTPHSKVPPEPVSLARGSTALPAAPQAGADLLRRRTPSIRTLVQLMTRLLAVVADACIIKHTHCILRRPAVVSSVTPDAANVHGP